MDTEPTITRPRRSRTAIPLLGLAVLVVAVVAFLFLAPGAGTPQAPLGKPVRVTLIADSRCTDVDVIAFGQDWWAHGGPVASAFKAGEQVQGTLTVTKLNSLNTPSQSQDIAEFVGDNGLRISLTGNRSSDGKTVFQTMGCSIWASS